MAGDTELDRLKDAQDHAFQRKQDAYQVMQRAWERRSAARDALDRAYTAKQSAYEIQDAAWQDLQRLRDHHGPRIEWLNSQQENAFQNMREAFDRASAAHDARDGASARMYADQGHSYKAESQGYVAERRQLIQELRNASDHHNGTRPAFQRAKAEFDQAKRTHDAAKAEHERKQEEFKRAKADFDKAVQAFKKRLEVVRAEAKRRQSDKRSIAERAGVPSMYLDNIWVSREQDGTYNIYFGGMGKPNGPGHGHYVLKTNGTVTYAREPFDPHGAHNFANEELLIKHEKEKGHRGGFGQPFYAELDGHPVTVALGWGTKEGETLLADGHVNRSTLRQHGNHNHYGSGRGSHGNVQDRLKYTGPGA